MKIDEIILNNNENLSAYHILLMENTIVNYKASYTKAKKYFLDKSKFVDEFVHIIMKDILNQTKLESIDRNKYITFLNFYLTLEALVIYDKQK